MADLWLIRHGQAGPVMGEYDQLSQLGWQQSRRAGEHWRHLAPVDHVVHGAMRRHRETLHGFTETFGPLPSPHEDADWNEFDHQAIITAALSAGLTPEPGAPRGAFFSFFHQAMGRWAAGEHDNDYPEPYAQFQRRVVAAFERAVQRTHSAETTVVFTSGGPISAVVRHLLRLEPRAAFEVNTVLVNSGLTRIRVGDGRTSLASLNVHPHLDGVAGLETRS
jgi:broad specificity phosphatase PhoE